MTRTLPLLLAALGTLTGAARPAAADEKLPPNAKVLRLDARPAAVELTQPFAYAQLVVTAHLDGGDTADVTRIAAIGVPGVVKVSPAGQVRPAANGTGDVTIT